MENIYAALLLHKLGKEISEDNLKKVVTAAGMQINSDEESSIRSLVVSLKGVDIDKELESAALVSATPVVSEVKEKKEEVKEEKKEAAAEGLSALFG